MNFSEENVSVVEAWSQAEIIPLFTVYGHMSRVWKSFILDDARFVSAGEVRIVIVKFSNMLQYHFLGPSSSEYLGMMFLTPC